MEDIETKYLYKFLIKFYFAFILICIVGVGVGLIYFVEWNKQEKCFELLKTAPEHNKEMVWKKCNE